jgi:nucleoside-diphosphate-sugar epimerase
MIDLNNSIWITGANGFVGRSLIDFLENNSYSDIHSIDLRKIDDKIDLPKNSTLVHLAGKAHDLKKVSSKDEYYKVNFNLTKDLFDVFLTSSAKKFIFFSSVKACKDNVDSFLKEIDIPNPQTHYGKSKLIAEEYIQKQFLPLGKSYYILRPCMIHGPGNKGNLNLLYKLVSKNIPWPLGAFENKRSFCSIDNLMFIIEELIERDDIPSGIYNIADDETLSTNEVISVLAESLNRSAKIWKISKALVQYVAKIGNFFRLPLNEERLQKLTDSYVVSNEKIKTALGKSLPVSSKEGLLKTFKSFS